MSLNGLGNEALIGAPYQNAQTGAAYIFVRRDGQWIEQQKLVPPDGQPNDQFGASVSLNALGNVAIVGAWQHNGNEGSAYVYVNKDGTWSEQQELVPGDALPGDISDFGFSVSINAVGNQVLVGAPSHNSVGAAYVFVRHGDTWVQQQELQPSDGAPGDGFGWSVALDYPGDEAVIGSPEHNVFVGSAYVFVHRDDGWRQQQELQPSDGTTGDVFGISVAVDAPGDEAIVGAIGHNGVVGAAYVFARRGDQWSQQAELQPSDGTPGDGFGISVALNAFGNKALVGAYAQDAGQGAAYVFGRWGDDWRQQRELHADDAQVDLFGYSVSLNAFGDEGLVGAPGHDGGTGAAYVVEGI